MARYLQQGRYTIHATPQAAGQRAATPMRGRGPVRVDPTLATSFVDSFEFFGNL